MYGFTLSLDGSKVAAELQTIAKLNNQDGSLTNGNFETIAYTITYQTKLPTDNSKVNNWTNTANQKNPNGTQTGQVEGIVANSWHNDIWGTQPKDGVYLISRITTGTPFLEQPSS